MSHLIVVRAVGGLLHGRVLLVISNLHTHHGVHVEANQLPGLDHCDADLKADIRTSDVTLRAKTSRPALYAKCHEVTSVVIWSK